MPQQMEGNGTFVIRIIISHPKWKAVGGVNRGNIDMSWELHTAQLGFLC